MPETTMKESRELLKEFRENFSSQHIQDIEEYLSLIKEGKKKSEEKGKMQIVERIRSSAINCLNNGKCAQWLGAVQKVDFTKLKKPSTPEGHCFYANAEALVSLIGKISDPTKNDFWGNVSAAHTAVRNLKKYYENGGVDF